MYGCPSDSKADWKENEKIDANVGLVNVGEPKNVSFFLLSLTGTQTNVEIHPSRIYIG
jgi:hypothetical protein